MKKFLIISFLFCLHSALYSAVLALYEAHIDDLDTTRPQHIINRMLESDRIDFCISIRDDLKPAKNDKIYAKVEGLVKKSFSNWTAGTAKRIRSKNRANEFESVLNVLEKDFRVNFEYCDPQNDDKYNLRFIVDTNGFQDVDKSARSFYTNDEDRAIYYRSKSIEPSALVKIIRAIWPGRPLLATTMHEMGHGFGLADQYNDVIRDKRYGVYGTKEPRRSVMRTAASLTCDDADGMITLIDRFSDTPRTFKSICGDGIEFVNGMEVIKKLYEKRSLQQADKLYKTREAYVLNPDTFKEGKYQFFSRREIKTDGFFYMTNDIPAEIITKYGIGHKVTVYLHTTVTETRETGVQQPEYVERIFDFGDDKIYQISQLNPAGEYQKNAVEMLKHEFEKIMEKYPNRVKPGINITKIADVLFFR